MRLDKLFAPLRLSVFDDRTLINDDFNATAPDCKSTTRLRQGEVTGNV